MERQALLGAPPGKAKEGKNKEHSDTTLIKIILVVFILKENIFEVQILLLV
jgi:hypothetical protein